MYVCDDQQLIIVRIMLPLPFTISFLFLVVAFLTSKLQYPSTYLLISIYSLLGPIETAAIALSLSSVMSGGDEGIVKVLLICSLGAILVLNVLGWALQRGYLMQDIKFRRWANRKSKLESVRSNLVWFHIISFLSLATSYKLKMVLFSRLFSFQCFKFQLEHIEKFKIFNILSFIGYLPQILALYCCVIVLGYSQISMEERLVHVDCLVTVVLNMGFSVTIIKKDSGFFHDQLDGVQLNKVYNTIEEINSTTAFASLQERERRGRRSRMSLQDIVEADQFAYTSTKRDRTNSKKHKLNGKEGKEIGQSYYFQASSQEKTGSRIHTQKSQGKMDRSVGAPPQKSIEEQNIVQVDQNYQQSTSVDQNQDKINGIQRKEECNIVHVISHQIPLAFPRNTKPLSIYSSTILVNIGGKQQQANTNDTKLSQQQKQYKLIEYQINSVQQESDSTLANFIAIDTSAILQNQEPSIINPLPTPQEKKMAKNMVIRVMSAHHSPNKRIGKEEGNVGLSRTIITQPINELFLNQQHDQQPIKNRSMEKAKRHRNHPINAVHSDHPLHSMKSKQSDKQQEKKSRLVCQLAERKQLLRRRLQQKRQEQYENSLNAQAQNNFYEQFLHSKQDSSKQFKRTNLQSLALFSKNKTQNQASLIAQTYSTDNIPRQPRSIINLIDKSQSQQSNFMLSRAFDRKKAIKFTSKSRIRPQTSKNKEWSLESKASSSILGKKMNSLQKIYLQKLYNQ